VERLTTQKEKKITTPLTKNKKNKIKALQLPREHRKATAQHTKNRTQITA
jgi:hypothetical protein